ncbi:MAG: hypothetical protein QNJ45_09640 [Ardenticatenaceae bacterium]|nr:hypothetical protein [Ardenticatenaceae bacterium]
MAKDRQRYLLALKKGQQLNKQKNWKAALAAFRVALSEFNNQPAVYVGIGEACVGLKQLKRAMECYKLAARLDRTNVKHLLNVADIQERMGLLSDAGKTYMAAGEFNLRARDADAAIGNWERAVRLDSNLIGAHKRLAMIFQRQGDRKAAVREYLAIARILDMVGDKEKALQICRAALRLDPQNGDIHTAMELIEKGEEAYPELGDDDDMMFEAEEPAAEEEDSIFGAVRQMADMLEQERSNWQLGHAAENKDNPLELAKRQAEEDLAAELFREEVEEDVAGGEMIKLERDALISQAMDFQARHDGRQAIAAYERALNLGLNLPAAHFMLGVLYAENNQTQAAYRALAIAAKTPVYETAARQLLSQLN